MADNNEELSFSIVDTIASSSQQLIDSFLEGDSKTNPEDIVDINTPAPKKVAPVKKVAKEEEELDEDGNPKKPVVKPFNPLEDITDEEELDENGEKKKPVVKVKATAEGEEDELNTYEAFSKDLYKIGAFDKEGEGEPELPKTGEDFLKVFNEQVGKRADEAIDTFLEKFGDDYKQAFNAIFLKGVDPKDYYQTYNKIENFAALDIKQEANQERIVRQSLSDLGYEAEDIDSEVSRLKQYGDLEKTAEKHHKVLIKKEQAKLQDLETQSQQKLEQQKAVKQQFVTNISSVLDDKLKTKDFDGIPLNPSLVSEVKDMLITEKWKNATGDPLTDFDVEILNLKKPENHAKKAKLALLLAILKKDPTLSTIKKSVISKQTDNLFESVTRNRPKSQVGTKVIEGDEWGKIQ